MQQTLMDNLVKIKRLLFAAGISPPIYLLIGKKERGRKLGNVFATAPIIAAFRKICTIKVILSFINCIPLIQAAIFVPFLLRNRQTSPG